MISLDTNIKINGHPRYEHPVMFKFLSTVDDKDNNINNYAGAMTVVQGTFLCSFELKKKPFIYTLSNKFLFLFWNNWFNTKTAVRIWLKKCSLKIWYVD